MKITQHSLLFFSIQNVPVKNYLTSNGWRKKNMKMILSLLFPSISPLFFLSEILQTWGLYSILKFPIILSKSYYYIPFSLIFLPLQCRQSLDYHFSPVVLRFQQASESPGRIVKTQVTRPLPKEFLILQIWDEAQ